MTEDNKNILTENTNFNIPNGLKSYLAESYNLYTSDKAEGYFDDADKVILEASSCLSDFKAVERLGTDKYYVLNSLGKSKEYKENLDLEKLEKTAIALVDSCASVSFMLKKSNGETRFLINGKNLVYDTVESSLKSHMESADISACDFHETDFKTNGFAKCVKFPISNEHTDKSRSVINWISALVDADIKDDYCVSVYADNVDRNAIRESIKDLTQIHKRLIRFTDVTKNISINHSVPITNVEGFVESAGKAIKNTIGLHSSSEPNSSAAISLSHLNRNAYIVQLAELLKNRISELTEALFSNLKSITLVCSCDKILTFNQLTSIINSGFAGSEYSIAWKTKGEIEPAIEILAKDIPRFFQLPFKEFPGFERKENLAMSVNAIDKDGDLKLGKIYWNSVETENQFTISLDKLNRHTSVFGMTGGGKSNTVFSILEQSKVPFLVIEPVKSEYRILKNAYDNLEVHHTDTALEGVLRVNPFWFPKGGSLTFHMDALKKIISSAFALYAAMPNILEQCIYRCYVKKGWNIIKNRNLFEGKVPDEYLYPTFSDLCDEIEVYLNSESGFEGETLATYRGALLTRLRSFTSSSKGVLLNSTCNPDFESWIDTNHVIELDGLADDADKSIVMGTIIVQYFQCVKKRVKRSNKLKHLVVVEEAHRLFKQDSDSSSNQEQAAPEAQLVETLSNMMAEIRAYGEGFIIVDQSPTKVSENVVSNSATKIVHRLDNKKDIDMLESSLLIKDMSTVISSLTLGAAVVRTEGMQTPIKLQINLSHTKDMGRGFEFPEETSGLDNISNVDYIMSNKEFAGKFRLLIERFMNHLLYDELGNGKYFFSEYLSQLSRLLYLNGFIEIAENADKNFYLTLTSTGVKHALVLNGTNSGLCSLYIRMFADRFCELFACGKVKYKEIVALRAFRESVIYENISIINANSDNVIKKSINKICGFNTIYADIVYELTNYLNDQDFFGSEEKFKNISYIEENLSSAWTKLFLIKPSSVVCNQMILLVKAIFDAVMG